MNLRFTLQPLAFAAAIIMAWPAVATAAPLALSSKPMYLGNTAKPNLVFNMDDSGSMGWDYMPDEANDSGTCKGSSCDEGEPPYYASDYNTIYYDPEVTYTPALNYDETSMGDMDSATTSAWTAVPQDAFGAQTTSTTNLTSNFPDKKYYEYVTVYSGASFADGCGSAPCVEKSGGWVFMRLPSAHGLTTGDRINVTNDGGGCDNDLQVSNAAVTVVDAFSFWYYEGGGGFSGSEDCRVSKRSSTGLQNGIDTNNPFEYRVHPTLDEPLVHGLPSSPYDTVVDINTNAHFYTIIPMEHCSDAALTNCIASAAPTATHTYPAPVRFCTNRTNADLDAPVSDGAICRGKYSGTYDTPRYGKFYRQDIVPAVTTYGNVTVDGYTVIDRSNRTDCATAPVCTYAEEMTNFANWYAYYRLRINSMKTSAGRAFAELAGENIRIGYAKINQGSATIDGVSSTGAMRLGVRDFTGAAKQAWFTEFYGTSTSGSTPLRRAMKYVGEYYSRADSRGPWGSYPENSSTTELSSAHAACRQSYQLLCSDGYYNGSSPSIGDADGTDGPVISTPVSWPNTAVLPYKDTGSSDSLADVAMYYWKNDLRTNLDNIVEINTKDPAFWQHMVSFTLGFGLEGILDPDTDLPALTAGTTTSAGTIGWPSASSNQIDDMWHAAINGRGQFFSVDNPTALVNSIKDVFSDITDRTSSAASVAIDTAVTTTSRAIYQARFYSGDWTGTVKSFPVDLDTGVIGTENWDAQTQVSAQNWDTGRFVATWDTVASPNAGTPFRWADLTAAQQTALNLNASGTADARGSDRVEFIRGRTGISGFRPRTTGVLGDVVHSSPIYVAAPPRSYSGTYETFKTANASRTPMIYVGANDGMLHALEAATGSEKFAFVPNAVIGELSKLTASSYIHQYYVDGPITVEDIEVGGSWKTALVGALGSGGKAVYALDITNPVLSGATTALKEADLASKVMWEFTHADLGYVHGEVAIAKMANGVYAAIFGNGYNNSGTGKATLYVVNAATGALLKSFSVGGGTVGTPSGMAAPLPVDVNGDSVVDYIYAGDLEGKVWKFDVTSTSTGSWDSAFNTAGVPQPLFAATDASSNPQPITSRVEVGRHPSGPGYTVFFGTGKYLENADNASTGQNTQTFYGVWDKDTSTVPTFTRAHLLEQTIDYQIPGSSSPPQRPARVSSDNNIVWHWATGNPTGSPITEHLGWYMDLQNPANSNANEGERLITNPILIAGRIIFATFLPPVDVCSGGGDSWIIELDAIDGSRLESSVWDINMDTSVDGGDYVDVGGGNLMQVSGTASTVGAVASPTVVSLPGGQRQIKLLSGTTGMVETIHEAPGDAARARQSWIRLQ
ncbi:MAG: PilC/PilY family type IV pilus protein [Mariprofundaceae bacterium]|nr:PilC/PilY family type IV pilus protein [Mariprofundaceae bacterium]